MKLMRENLLPKTGDHLKEGLRLLVINTIIYLGVGCSSLGILWAVHRIRLLGIPLPLPIWLILLGMGIPCFIFWFQYGKTFGVFVRNRRITKGLALGILGNMPGFIASYIIISLRPQWLDLDIYRVIFTIYAMFFLTMPIMTVLGVMDRK